LFRGLDQRLLTAATPRRFAAAGMPNALLDLGYATGVHIVLRGDSVHEFTAAKTALNFNRVFEGEAATRPPRFRSVVHDDLAVSASRLNVKSERDTLTTLIGVLELR
jgi:hypothetical protein